MTNEVYDCEGCGGRFTREQVFPDAPTGLFAHAVAGSVPDYCGPVRPEQIVGTEEGRTAADPLALDRAREAIFDAANRTSGSMVDAIGRAINAYAAAVRADERAVLGADGGLLQHYQDLAVERASETARAETEVARLTSALAEHHRGHTFTTEHGCEHCERAASVPTGSSE